MCCGEAERHPFEHPHVPVCQDFIPILANFGTYSEGGCVIYLSDLRCLIILEQYNLLQVQWSFPHQNRYNNE